MLELSPIVLSIILIFLGLGFFLLILIFLRVLPKLQPLAKGNAPPPASSQVPSHHEAVLLVQTGGRVVYLNQEAHDLFNVWEEEPNLENLARRARPSEIFLALCASEGQAHFSLNGRLVEGTSYFTPASAKNDGEPRSTLLVSLRRPQLVIESDSPLATSALEPEGNAVPQPSPMGISNQAFSILTELNQAMAASLDLEKTLQTILESVERLFPSDFMEITIWEEVHQHLVPYRLVGLAGVDRHLEKATDRRLANQGYPGYLITNHQPLLIKDVAANRQVRPALERQQYPFQSYLGMPLLIAGKLIGTLELASLTIDNYSESDLEVIRLLSGQATIAINNAQLYKQELERSVEFAGLANLAKAVTAIRDPQDLYAQLVESIAPLIPVEILGFLIYDENRRVLEGQSPFMGIPSVLEWYQAAIQPGSPAEAVLQAAETIVTSDAPEEASLKVLELHNLAVTAGFRHAVFSPLTAGGRTMGYLLAANKREGTPFDKNDLRLLEIIAGQAAPIIENATLVRQSRRRAQRAETLRRIASLTSSAATLDEILKYSLIDLARLLQADIAAIILLDESRGELRPHKSSLFGISPETSNHLGRLSIDDPQFANTVTGSKQQFVSGDLSGVMFVLPLYQPLMDELNIRAVVVMPLVSRERGIGELIVGSFRSNFFSDGDVQTVATSSGQLASAIEQSSLYSLTDQSLRQRVEQLTALTRISRELNITLDLNHLLKRVFDEALRTTHANCGTILLFDLEDSGNGKPPRPEGPEKSATLPPKISLYLGDTPSENLQPLEQKVFQEGESIIIEDFEALADNSETEEAQDKTSLAYSSPHSGFRSALVVPISYQGQVAGLIELHAKTSNHFSDTERDIGESLATQAAIALGNAQRLQEQQKRSELLNRRVETLSKLVEVSQDLQTEQPVEQSLEAIAYAIQTATPFDVVLISLYDEQNQQLVRVAGAGLPLATLAELHERPQPWNSVQTLLSPEYRLGRTYFIPREKSGIIPADIHIHRVLPGTDQPTEENNWNPDDIFFVPLFNIAGEPLGLISVDAPRDNLRPDRPTIETLEIFSSQAALVIESQFKVRNLRTKVDSIQSELGLAQEAAHKAQSHLPVLLHKDLEQTLSIQNLSQQARRINAGLDIAEIISQQTARSDIFSVLGQETLSRMNFDCVLVAEPTSGGLSLTYSLGSLPAEVNPKALLGQRNPLRQCLQTGEILLVSDLNKDEEWQNTPLLRALDTKSFFCLPVGDTTNGRVESQGGTGDQPGHNGSEKQSTHPLAAVLAVSRTPLAPFTADDEQLYSLLSHQVAIALQNLDLLEEAKHRLREVNLLLDFSRQLGSLEPSSILQTLVESALHAVPTAESAMVALWDAKQGLLIPQAASGYADDEALMQVVYRPGEGLAGQVFEQRHAFRLDEVDFARHYNLSPENLLRFRNATGGQLPVSNLTVPIMAGITRQSPSSATDLEGKSEKDQWLEEARATPLGVLVLDNARTTSAFGENDLAVITSLAQQTALTLENARLYKASEQRSGQLQALTGVSTAITSSLKKEELIASLLDQLQTVLPYDTGTLWLREREERRRARPASAGRMVVRSARGFEDSDERIGLAVDVQDSQLLNEMIQTGKPIWVANVQRDPRFRALSLTEDWASESEDISAQAGLGYGHLSWLGVPLVAAGEVMGVIALEKTEPNFYTSDDIQVVIAFAGQAAIGLENADLYQESVNRALELDQRSQTLTILNRLSSELSGSLDAKRIIGYAVQEFAQVMPCTSVSALLFDDAREDITLSDHTNRQGKNQAPLIIEVEYSQNPLDDHSTYTSGAVLPDTPLFERLRETRGIFNTEDVTREPDLAPLREFLSRHSTNSLLIVPILSGGAPSGGAPSGGAPSGGASLGGMPSDETPGSEITTEPHFHGMLLAHNSQPFRFSPSDVELARTISYQVAIALQNARLFRETSSLSEDLEARVQIRTSELEREHQRAETLLRIITELSASLDLEQVLHRTLRVLSEFVDAEQISILISRPGEEKLIRLASVGYPLGATSTGGPTPFDVDQGLAGWIISQRQSAIVEDVLDDERWIMVPYTQEEDQNQFRQRSALGVPLMSGAEALGCLLLFHSQVGHFSIDQLDLVQAAANQVAVAVNNAELYRLIRDQAEDLGNMLRQQQIETSRSKAILEAVADGVLVTDAKRQITLFNESAENILGMERSQVLGKSMEHFSGLFGRATRSWMETIEVWSQDPASHQHSSTYSEELTLEDGRVFSVHLAPVSLRNDFLGTVSIFQDITHRVEVDRLKSEFVATVSHELRTPMTSIKGYVEILLMGAAGEMTEQQIHFLQIVKTNTERLAVLVNDLLDVSQIEAGRITLSLQALNIERVVNEAVADLKRRIQGGEKSIIIKKHVQPELPRVLGDAERIRRILDNLLDNAYQYNKPDGQISLKMHQVGEDVQVDIKDTGMGIHPEDQPRVFERFFRGENPLVLGVSGTGLGLSIVQNLVLMHNGRIWLESTGVPGEGCTFSFTIPKYIPEKE